MRAGALIVLSLVAAALVAARPGSVAAVTPTRAPALFALVVGYNRAPDRSLPSLQYADDDAVRNVELLRSLGAETVLLTELDRATRELHPEARPTAPRRPELEAALGALNERIAAARASGRPTVFYFFYTGHGDVRDGEGFLQLADGGFTRSALRRLLAACRAQVIHVVVDACKSYFAVFERGPGGVRRPAAGSFLPPDPEVPAHAGFVLSTSTASDSHEWEAFQGGVFSHEVRSALRGAADLDGDGRVTYEEAAAFIFTANRAVPNERYRPRFFVRPPRGASATAAVLSDLRRGAGRRLIFDGPRRSHFTVEDAAGVRLADLHPGTSAVALLVPAVGQLYVRRRGSGEEYLLPERSPATVRLSGLRSQLATARARGAEHEAFRRLFRDPFDGGALRSYRDRPDDSADDHLPRRPWQTWARPALLGAALATLTSAGILTGLGLRERGRTDETTSQLDRMDANRRIARFNAAAVSCYALGGAAAVGYLLWQLWPARPPAITVTPAFGAGGAGLQLEGRY
ncbi:MAG: caspase family protein [Deltaproteobacteria bacterium]|nr:caspase family protein [Deltaproteobacteria bacterium]